MTQSAEIDVVILGAGITGLYAGLKLARAGKRVALLEQYSEPGGLCRNEMFAGNYVDFGVNPMHITDAAINDDVLELLGPDHLEVQLDNRIRWGGQDVPYPFYPGHFRRGLNLGQKIGRLVGSLTAGWTSSKDPKDAEAFLKQLYGKQLYEFYFQDFIERYWGTSARDLSPLWVLEKLPPLMAMGSKHVSKNETALPAGMTVQYSTEGNGALARAMTQALMDLGGKIVCGAEVVSVETNKHRIESVTWRDTSSDPEDPVLSRVRCNAVISTIPVRSLLKCFGQVAPAQAHASSLHLAYRPLVAYSMLVRRQKCFEGFTTRFRNRTFHRISEPKNLGVPIKPDGHTLLIAELTTTTETPAWRGDEEVWNNILQDLKDEGVCNLDEVSNRNIIRSEHAYPIYRKGFEEHREKLAGFFRRFDNLECAGGTGTFTFLTFEESLQQAAMISERIQTTLGIVRQ